MANLNYELFPGFKGQRTALASFGPKGASAANYLIQLHVKVARREATGLNSNDRS